MVGRRPLVLLLAFAADVPAMFQRAPQHDDPYSIGRGDTELFTPEQVCRREREDSTLVLISKTTANTSNEKGKVDSRHIFVPFWGEPGFGEPPTLSVYIDV